jgi:hypothetical protein
VYVLMPSIYHALIGKMCIKNPQNALNATGVFILQYFHLHVSAGIRSSSG